MDLLVLAISHQQSAFSKMVIGQVLRSLSVIGFRLRERLVKSEFSLTESPSDR